MRRRANCRTLIQTAVVCCLATAWPSPVAAQSSTDEERACWGLTEQQKETLEKKWRVKESRWSDLYVMAESLLRSGKQLDKALDLLLLAQKKAEDPDLQAENYRGDVVFEYLPYFQLARAFLARNGPGDLECAQEAVRQATTSGQAQQSGDKDTRQEFDKIEARLRTLRAQEILASISQEVETWNRTPGHFSSPAGVARLQNVRDFLSRGDPAQATAWEAAIHDLAKGELEYGDDLLRQLSRAPWNQVFTPESNSDCVVQDREIAATWDQVPRCQTAVVKELRVALKSACDSLGERKSEAADELAALRLYDAGVTASVHGVLADCNASWPGMNGSDLIASMGRIRLSDEISAFDSQIADLAQKRGQQEQARTAVLRGARDLLPPSLPATCSSETFQATAIFDEFASLGAGFRDALEGRKPLHEAPRHAEDLVRDQHSKLQDALTRLSNKYSNLMTKCDDPQTSKFQEIARKLTDYRNTGQPTELPNLCRLFDAVLGDHRDCVKDDVLPMLASLRGHDELLSTAARWRPRTYKRPDCLNRVPAMLPPLLVTEEQATDDTSWPERAVSADGLANDCSNQYRAAHSGWTAQVMSGFDAFPDIPGPDEPLPELIKVRLGPMRQDLRVARDIRQGLGALLQWPEGSDAPQDLQQREEALSRAELQELDDGLSNIEITSSKHKEPLDRLEPTIAPWNAFRQALNFFDDGELDAAIGSLREAAEQEQHLEGNRKARYSHLRHVALAYFLFVKWSALDDAGGNLAQRFENDARQEIAAAGASGEFPLPDELASNKDFEKFYKRSI